MYNIAIAIFCKISKSFELPTLRLSTDFKHNHAITSLTFVIWNVESTEFLSWSFVKESAICPFYIFEAHSFIANVNDRPKWFNLWIYLSEVDVDLFIISYTFSSQVVSLMDDCPVIWFWFWGLINTVCKLVIFQVHDDRCMQSGVPTKTNNNLRHIVWDYYSLLLFQIKFVSF
jgi:hypothetical protein